MMRKVALLRTWGWVAISFLVELAKSTYAVIAAVLAGNGRLRPALVAVPLDVRSPAGITLFANMVTLTPGTTSLEISEDRTTLYVHVLDAASPQAAAAGMKASLETEVRKVLP